MEHKKSADNPETRVIQEFERYMGRTNVQISVEPIEAWRGVPSDAYQVNFTYEGGHDIMGLHPNAETPVWDLYGRPSQVYRGKSELLKDLKSLTQ
jgi:hypothetical protein